MQQKIPLQMASISNTPREAQAFDVRGTETTVPPMSRERLAALPTIEQVVERKNMFAALKRVQQNKGAPGIDGMTVEELPDFLKREWPRIKGELLSGAYRPLPVRRVEIPKPDGGVRLLGIPAVIDRLIQQATMQVLQADWDSTFSPHSHGFRPGKGAHGAVKEAQQYIKAGYRVVVDIDLEKFFDRVNHDILMGLVRKRVEDRCIVTLVRNYLNAGVMVGGLVSRTKEGVPQGGPLSPLLSNLMLNELDRELERRGLHFVRYADDCNIYVRSRRAGERVKASITRYLATKLKLRVNEAKSAVAYPYQRTFLGFSFFREKVRLAPKSVTRLKERIRDLTGRNAGRNLEQTIEGLSTFLRSWDGYFHLDETYTTRMYLDGWIRRRLRCLAWKQWKTSDRRYKMLVKLGVPADLAALSTFGARRNGHWKMSTLPGIKMALNDERLASSDLYSLLKTDNAA